MRTMLLAAAIAVGSAALTPASAAGADGFAPFWRTFTAAVAKDDRAALAGMVVLSERVDEAEPLTFARFHSDQLGPPARKCLASAKPVRGVDGKGEVNYSAYCGELIYTFYHTGGAWKLTDIGVND